LKIEVCGFVCEVVTKKEPGDKRLDKGMLSWDRIKNISGTAYRQSYISNKISESRYENYSD